MMTPDPPITGYDSIEFWVGNAKQAAHYYRTAFGFELVGYAGPETGVRDHASYVLDQHDIRLVMSSGLTPDHPMARHHARHGDGIRDVAFRVHDVAEVFETATARGAATLREPEVLEDEHGKLMIATIAVYGDTVHSFVQRDAFAGVHRPGYQRVLHDPVARSAGLTTIDHVVSNVDPGDMEIWSRFYEDVLDLSQLHHFDDETISTEDTALTSKVLGDGTGRIRLPINEPAPGSKRSQIAEYLEAYGGPGVQHLALASDDIVRTVRDLRSRGVTFLSVPDEYYDRGTRERVGDVGESWDDLAELGVLVDRDEAGYLLQIFTEPVQDRPTVFYEIIQRHGATGFGVGNFKALFRSIERAQARRGNL